jgi:hypothetical protein
VTHGGTGDAVTVEISGHAATSRAEWAKHTKPRLLRISALYLDLRTAMWNIGA